MCTRLVHHYNDVSKTTTPKPSFTDAWNKATDMRYCNVSLWSPAYKYETTVVTILYTVYTAHRYDKEVTMPFAGWYNLTTHSKTIADHRLITDILSEWCAILLPAIPTATHRARFSSQIYCTRSSECVCVCVRLSVYVSVSHSNH